MGKTSSAVKRKYNDKTYTSWSAALNLLVKIKFN